MNRRRLMMMNSMTSTTLGAIDIVEVSMLCHDGSDGKNGQIQLNAIGANGSNLNSMCTWSSNVSNRATVINGLVSSVGISFGIVTISATYKGITYSTQITVYDTMPNVSTRYTLSGGKGKNVIGANGDYLCCFVTQGIPSTITLPYMRFMGKTQIPPMYATYALHNSGLLNSTNRAPMIYYNNPCIREELINESNRTIINKRLNSSLTGVVTMDLSYSSDGYVYNGAGLNSGIIDLPEGPYGLYTPNTYLIFSDQLEKTVLMSWNETSISNTDLLNRSMCGVYYIPQNYIRYYDRPGFSNQTVIPNIGTLGSVFNVTCDVTPAEWY